MNLKEIQKTNHYLQSGNIFSKNILVQDYLAKNPGPVLHIYSEENILKTSQKISHYLWVWQNKIHDLHDYLEFYHNDIWNYSTTTDVFYAQLPESEYDINKHILSLEKWQEIPLENISKQLHEMWFKHSAHGSKSSFHIQWEVLSIVNNYENYEYKISFWWDEIEEIFIIDKSTNQSQSREKISIWDRNYDFFTQEKKYNWKIFHQLKNKTNIFYQYCFCECGLRARFRRPWFIWSGFVRYILGTTKTDFSAVFCGPMCSVWAITEDEYLRKGRS